MADPTVPMPTTNTTPELLDALRCAAARPLTADEIRKQRISWCVAQTGHPRDLVVEALRRMEGDDADGR